MTNPPFDEKEAGRDGHIPGQYQDILQPEEYRIGSGDFNPTDIPTDDVEIENPVSQVASAPAKNILIIGVLVIISVIFLYKIIFKDSEKLDAEKKLQEKIDSQPISDAKPATPQEGAPQVNIGVVETPELPVLEENMQALPPPVAPELPKEVEVPVPAEPVIEKANNPAPPPEAKDENVKVAEPILEPIAEVPGQIKDINDPKLFEPTEEQLRAQEAAKRKIGMLVINGGGTPADVISGKTDPNAIAKSSASQVKATKVDDLSLMILQGKMIDAVLETTINTDLPGNLRAIISRDIYAESGKHILIPRGSRLIGSYSSGVQPGQTRVVISWGRVIRPDGVDIDIASSGTDQLGRSGMTGIVDNKYFEIFSNSLLASIVTIGGSILLEQVTEAQETSNTSTSNATTGTNSNTQSGKASDLAILQGTKSFADQATKIVQGISNTNPTIIVNQGARIKVFVNKDLIFPASVVTKVSAGN